MSFEGIGTLIGGMFIISVAGPLLVAGAATLLAGGATYLAVKAGAGITKALYTAYSQRQSMRHQQVSRDLQQVQGDIGEAARRQEMRIQTLIDQGNAVYQQAVEARHRAIDEMQNRMEQMEDIEQLDQVLQAELKKSEQEVDAVIDREVTRFQADLQQSCQAESEALTQQIRENSAAFTQAVEQTEALLDERQERYRAYAESLSREGGKLLEVLMSRYDWQRFAAASTDKVMRLSQEIEHLLKTGDARLAATIAVDYEDQLLALQSELTWKTAVYEHQELCVKSALEELKAVREAANRFAEDAQSLTQPGQLLEGYVSTDLNVEFWSEGRITQLFDRADRLEQEADDFESHSVVALTAEMRRLTEQIRREHARTRAFLANRAAVLKTAETVYESMVENGWTLAEDGGYLLGDPRKDFEMAFENVEGDRRVVTVCTEYHQESGQYMVHVERLSYEHKLPDEDQRRREDEALNEAMARRRLGAMSVSCNSETRGMSRPKGV